MTVCFFKFPLVDTIGGAEFHTLKLAQFFQKQNHRVKLYTSDRKLFELFQKNQIPAKHLFAGWEPTSKRSLLLWPLTCVLAWRQFKPILRDTPPDSVFFFQSLTEKLIFTPLALRQNIKVIWAEHKIPGRWLKLNPLLPRFRKLAARVLLLTVSDFAKQEFAALEIPEQNIRAIYPGVRISPAAAKTPPANFTLGLLSRLAPEKGVKNFLKIITPVLAIRKNWQILVAGTGAEQAEIQKWIEFQKLAGQIHLLGHVENLDEYFSKISVLVYPSQTPESFGIAVAEALARGVPVVASKLGALPEIIAHEKTGFLVETSQPEQWEKYLKELESPETYEKMSREALVSASRFDETKTLPQVQDLIFS